MVTRADVAKAARVSPSTVSYVLSGARPTSEETKKRVHDAIDRLGWVPDVKAGSLAARRLHTIGLHLDLLERGIDSVMGEYISGIIRESRERGLYFLIPTTRWGDRADFRQFLRSKLVNGLIYMQVESDDWREEILLEENFPAIALGCSGRENGVPYVESDFPAIARLAIDKCIEFGHREAVLLARQEVSYELRRTVGSMKRTLLDYAFKKGLRMQMIEAPWHSSAMDAVLPKLLEVGRPTVVIVENIIVAEALVPVAHAAGLEMIRDYSVVSLAGRAQYDVGKNLSFSEVATDRVAMGRKCVAKLVEAYRSKITGEQVSNEMFAPIFIDRGTLVRVG